MSPPTTRRRKQERRGTMLFELFKQIRTVLAEAYHVEFDSYGIVSRR